MGKELEIKQVYENPESKVVEIQLEDSVLQISGGGTPGGMGDGGGD